MTTKLVNLGPVYSPAVEYLEQSITSCARKGGLFLTFHNVVCEEGEPLTMVVVYVMSENEGSVSDFASFYLTMLIGHAYDFSKIDAASQQYKTRLRAWYEHEAEQKKSQASH